MWPNQIDKVDILNENGRAGHIGWTGGGTLTVHHGATLSNEFFCGSLCECTKKVEVHFRI